ncbi:MAG: S8 family serine peptidase [Wenzhouxiangella sp.]|nr:S8 family serine peptidase [Wenzhouxiangella sp.]
MNHRIFTLVLALALSTGLAWAYGVNSSISALVLKLEPEARAEFGQANELAAQTLARRVPGQMMIRLQQAAYDPTLGAPPGLPPALIVADDDPAAGPYHLVQFRGPILARWRAELEQPGSEIMDYVPDYAYIVRADPEALVRVRSLEPVRWTGILQPAFRLSTQLWPHIASARANVPVEINVRLFPGVDAARQTQSLATLGASILHQFEDSGGGAILRARVSEATLVELANLPDLAWIEPYHEPVFANAVARGPVALDQDRIENELGLFGQGQIVAVGDSGLSTGDPDSVHLDFAGRIVGGTWGGGTCGSWRDDNSHGTHVAGSVLGSGARSGADIPNQDYAGSHAGIAPEAGLYVWSFCNNFSGLPNSPYANYYGVKYAIDPSLRISTNSWGFNGDFGRYNTFTRETDRFVRDHLDMVLTFAAGNSGRDSNSSGVVNLGSINMPSTAKNVITVGASENLQSGNPSTWGSRWPTWFPVDPIFSDLVSDNINGMAAFSSRGPTLSNRLKPDLVAPGTNIISTRNESTGTGWGVFNTYYLYMGGTSMATPLVAGAAAVVREFYQVEHGLNPSAALVKATLVNGAVDMTPGQYGSGSTPDVTGRPDNNQGWGRVDLPNSLIQEHGRQKWFHEGGGLNTGESFMFNFAVEDSSLPLRITLTWTDFHGTEASHGALVNDLDLELTTPSGNLIRGNEGLAAGEADRSNNVEGIALANPATGVYTLTVRAYNIPQGPQPFALVASGGLDTEPGFSLSALQTRIEICAGDDAEFVISTIATGGFSDPVQLSASGLPGTSQAQIEPNPITPGISAASINLSLTDTGDVDHGSYPLLISGESGGPEYPSALRDLGLTLDVFASPPDAPNLLAPAASASEIGLTPTLYWTPVSLASSYLVEVATDVAFADVVVQQTVSGTSFLRLPQLTPGTRYFWRVTARNACSDIEVSKLRSFTTEFAYCNSPDSALPAPGLLLDSMMLDIDYDIVELEVFLDINIEMPSDLVAILHHVDSGTIYDLLNRPGVPDGPFGSGCNISDVAVWLVDGAPSAQDFANCANQPPGLGGTLGPAQPLESFSGLTLDGEWQLILDVAQVGGVSGSLNRWCLGGTFDTGSTVTATSIAEIVPANAQFVDEDYTVTVAVTGESPTGIIDVDDGSGASCQIILPANSCSLRSTTVGSRTIHAGYSGDAGHDPSSSSTSYEIVSSGPVALVFQSPIDDGISTAPTLPTVVVQVRNGLGQLVAGDNETVIEMSLESSPMGATLSGTTTLTVTQGEAHFEDLSIDQTGTGYRLQARDPDNKLEVAVSNFFDILGQSIFIDRFENDMND